MGGPRNPGRVLRCRIDIESVGAPGYGRKNVVFPGPAWRRKKGLAGITGQVSMPIKIRHAEALAGWPETIRLGGMLLEPERGPQRSGFSLLEMMLVLGLLGIFAGIGLGGLPGLRTWMARQDSRSLFLELCTACQLYRLEHGSWPEVFLDGELALRESGTGWRRALAPYMERRVMDRELADGFGNTDLYLVVDGDDDHWIGDDAFEALAEGQRPSPLWSRVVVYSLDGNGRLAAWSWSDEEH